MIQAIETTYDGHKFRSRLEARWALYFNFIGIKWEFEREAFMLTIVDDGVDKRVGYTPDFWLPDLRVWFEVKAEFGSYDVDVMWLYIAKAKAFCAAHQATICTSFGSPRDGEIVRLDPGVGVATATWARCSHCLAWDLGYDGVHERPCGHTTERIGHSQAEGALLDATAYRFWEPKRQVFKGPSKYEREEDQTDA